MCAPSSEETSASGASTDSFPASTRRPYLPPPGCHLDLSARFGMYRRLVDGDHPIGAVVSPRRWRSITDTNREYGKRRGVRRPVCVAVAHDHQQVDDVSFGETAEASREIRPAAAVQRQLRGSEHLSHI